VVDIFDSLEYQEKLGIRYENKILFFGCASRARFTFI